jgi:hypothetical protein
MTLAVDEGSEYLLYLVCWVILKYMLIIGYGVSIRSNDPFSLSAICCCQVLFKILLINKLTTSFVRLKWLVVLFWFTIWRCHKYADVVSCVVIQHHLIRLMLWWYLRPQLGTYLLSDIGYILDLHEVVWHLLLLIRLRWIWFYVGERVPSKCDNLISIINHIHHLYFGCDGRFHIEVFISLWHTLDNYRLAIILGI